jgi:diaminohydroxyphosphoribosylaminopyrimidine deaminase / 5-amino-6-(5-phosphoribosylamino)uracil reductase
MAQALVLAARGLGSTSPNPPVGALVVKNSRVVGAGYHRRAGGPHAEVYALNQAGADAKGATLYVTLEPCRHLDKRTPPCVPLALARGVRRVVIATLDPNPSVKGRGAAALRRAGRAVDVGILRLEANRLIEPYRTRVTTGRPFVTLKVAATLDGKIATARRESRWITGLSARRRAQQLRAQSDAIIVGIGTVLADNPSLTVRLRPARAPLRIVLDPRLRVPLRSKLLTDKQAPVLLVTTNLSPKSRRDLLSRRGADVLVLPDHGGRIQWKVLLKELGRRGMNAILIEGGAEVNASVLRSGMVDRVVFFLAPKLLGGQNAIGAIGGLAPARLSEALALRQVSVSRAGDDVVIDGRITCVRNK